MIEYKNNRLVINRPTCSCNYHCIPDANLYIGTDIIGNSVEYIKNHINGSKCMIVTDAKLHRLFGQKVIGILSTGFEVFTCIPPSEDNLKPDNAALGYIMMEYKPDYDFMIALGSGTVNDLVRYASYLLKIPFVSIGTAPSMDGYISVISPMLKGNLKINIPADYPAVGIYDLDIMATAPPEMLFAGFGDVIGKYIAKADWILSSYITGEHVCPYCIELSDQAINLVLSNIDEIAKNSSLGVKALLEALLLTGLAMLINTNSRPAASNEHNMGHFWEMMKLEEGKPHPSHGEAVGIATLYCLALYEKLFSLNPASINPAHLTEGNFNASARESMLLKIYGITVGRSIVTDNPDEPISADERLKRVDIFLNKFNEIKEAMSFLPDYRDILSIYSKLGGPLNAEQIGIEKYLLKNALLYAKDYRSRYSIFKTADELGILENLADEILDIF
ncbi:MAG: iron-containing alcohol dehydrogenase [Clostridia bacterium]|nr:iron-containing alcohol dehydrogenase [Clostridia bacterium]MBN2882058.1 iron-containing alcohol dehydrogenase [Clostridia bacterium]